MHNNFSAAAALLILAAGCESQDLAPRPAGGGDAPTPQKVLSQTILVVDNPDLASGIGLLRGEWNARSGNRLEVRSATLAEVLAAGELDADVVCYPPRYLGELAARDWLRPLRASLLESGELDADDFLPVIRHRAMVYDGQSYAVPLACQLTLFGFPRSQVDAWGDPPATYEQLFRRIDADLEAKLWVPPVGHPFRLAELLVAAAATQVAGETIEPLLFDPASMRPKIETTPFVRGLELTAPLASRLEPIDAQRLDDAAILWTRLPGATVQVVASGGPARGVSPAESRVTIVGLGGSQANVTRQTRNTAAAFRLLAWLASGEQTPQILRQAPALITCRQRLLPAAAAGEFGEATWFGGRTALAAAALEHDRSLRIPRIAGIDDYLAALVTAVEQVAAEGREPAAALAEAAGTWEAITERLGRDVQRKAYRRHLELP